MKTGPAEPPIPLYKVLVEELKHQLPDSGISLADVEKRRGDWERRFKATPMTDEERQLGVESALAGDFYRLVHERDIKRTALCISGGGIRSATFGLGVVQGLARAGLLRSLHFLSTVSGGGYLGGWLSGWIQREGGEVEKVERLLAGQGWVEREKGGELKNAQAAGATKDASEPPLTALEPEPVPIRHLRQYSRYMSPRFGLLSADTWTLVAIFFRNLMLNWMVLVPLLAAGLMLPRVGVVLARRRPEEWVKQGVFWLGVAAGIVAIAYIIANRPSLTSPQKSAAPRSKFPLKWRTQGVFLNFCLLPMIFMAFATTLYWAWNVPYSIDRLHLQVLGFATPTWLAFALFGVLLHLGGFVLSRRYVRTLPFWELVMVVVSGAVGGLLIWLVAWLAATKGFAHVTSELGLLTYVCLAAPVLLLVFLLAATAFIGLASKFTTDDDREWLARLGGWILIFVVMRASLSALVFFGPLLWHRAGVVLMSAVGGISGLATLLLGFSPATATTQKKRGEPLPATAKAANAGMALAAPLFMLSVFVGLSASTSLALRFLTHLAGRGWAADPALPSHGLLDVIAQAPGWAVVAVWLASIGLGLFAGYFVDINRFSLHGAYRDRLIRAYLGASRKPGTRRPNPFTGFDDQDNLALWELEKNRPFHLVNVTLNLVHGQDLAVQDRKAESFTFSALHCGYRGSYRPGGYRSSKAYGRHKDGMAISLGTAVAISGAAASPNMGAHSSPVITFLLALFNIRLGWWLGNTGRDGAVSYKTAGPRLAPAALLSEAFGLTDDTKPYVYLSDGGHFENFGLYEMVIRRCHYIVLSDGGQDPEFKFEDLGNALSKIRIDLGIPIEFESLPMRARPDLRGESYDSSKAEFPYFALARIRYSCVDYLEKPGDLADKDDADGWLLYIKPSLNGTEPADVFHYAKLHPTFPHESTGNQLYSEAQFESYRALGSHIFDSIAGLERKGPPLSPAQLFEKIRGAAAAAKKGNAPPGAQPGEPPAAHPASE